MQRKDLHVSSVHGNQEIVNAGQLKGQRCYERVVLGIALLLLTSASSEHDTDADLTIYNACFIT